jgi:putative oxidoreductase
MNPGVQIGVLVAQGLLGLFLAFSAYLNITRAPQLVKQWEHLRLPRWYTLLSATLLTIGTVAVLVGLALPIVGALAALWFVAFFVAATLTHVVRRDKLSGISVPMTFLVIFVALAILRWGDLAPLFSVMSV